MKQEDRPYDEWLAEVKSRQPLPVNPEELTAAILHRIATSTRPKKQNRFLAGAWISGIAATLLLALLVNDTFFSPAPQQPRRHGTHAHLPHSSTISLPKDWQEMQLREKSSYLFEQYAQHRQQRLTYISHLVKDNSLK